MNKCEELKIEHAWRGSQEMCGFQIVSSEICVNCDLKRTKCSQTKEWWSYSDDRPSEEIINIIPM